MKTTMDELFTELLKDNTPTAISLPGKDLEKVAEEMNKKLDKLAEKFNKPEEPQKPAEAPGEQPEGAQKATEAPEGTNTPEEPQKPTEAATGGGEEATA